MKNIEIERKWLVEGFPDLPMLGESEMEQGYLSHGVNTVRIRKTVQQGQTEYWLTIKGDGGLERVEVETPLREDQYRALSGLLVCPCATKRLRTYQLDGGLVLECSLVDEGKPGSFYYAEVEFDSLEAARAFRPMVFLRQEVTGKPGYSMAEYCLSKLGGGAEK